MQNKVKKVHFGVASRIAIMLMLFLIFAFSVAVFFSKARSTIITHQFFYSETSNLDYKVCLKENDYFTEKCLDKDRQYIASIIDYIGAEFKYNFVASDEFNYNYRYSINARIVATEKNNSSKIIYDESEVILEDKLVIMNDSKSFEILENLNIDYTKYNKKMNSFRKDYTLTLNSNLIITLVVEVSGDYEKIDDKVETRQSIDLTIPLSEQTVDVGMNYKNLNESESINMETKNSVINIVFYGLSVLFILLSLIMVLVFVKFMKRITIAKSAYTKFLEKIMREYNQIIVETKSLPKFDGVNVFDVDSFEELLDVRETIAKPILYIKIHSQKSYFIISNGNELYRFVLKDVDL